MLLCFGRKLPWDPVRALFGKITTSRPGEPFASRPRRETPPPPPRPDIPRAEDNSRVTQRELDALLDKLSNSCINSLSEHELARLRKARRQMRGEE